VSTILNQITAANTNAGIKNLSFANLTEFNSFMDGFNFNDWPQNVLVPYDINGTILNNRKKRILVLTGWVLTRITEDTNDWRSVKLEEKYIQPMRELAEKFITQLLNQDMVDPEVEAVSYSVKREYMFLNNHAFGVSYTINLPITAKIC
jgi:hypothetical protein